MSRFNPMRYRFPLLKRLIPSVKRRLWSLKHPQGFGVVASHGAKFLLNPDNFVDRQIVFYDDYERAQIAYLIQAIAASKGDLFLDVGAAFGYYSIILATRFPALAVVAFEPDKRNIDQFRANLDLNGLTGRVSVHHAAASAHAGRVGFHPGPAFSTGQSRIDATAPSTVSALAIDETLGVSGRSVVAKIDVEGHELEVLKGMERTLSENRCLLQIESYRENVARVKDHLGARGFTHADRIEHDYYFVSSAPCTAPRAQTAP